MDQALRLLGDRRDDGRVAVAERVHREAGLEVEILDPLGVPEPRALAAHELDGHPRVGADDVLALERLQRLEAHQGAGLIFVPKPASVNSSSRIECGWRPSTMCA